MTACHRSQGQPSCAPCLCPCPQACELPEPCATWQPGASTTPPHRPTPAAHLRALLAHAAVVLLACAALVFIVKTAPSP